MSKLRNPNNMATFSPHLSHYENDGLLLSISSHVSYSHNGRDAATINPHLSALGVDIFFFHGYFLVDIDIIIVIFKFNRNCKNQIKYRHWKVS